MTIGVYVEGVDVSAGEVRLGEGFFEFIVGDDPSAEADDLVPGGE